MAIESTTIITLYDDAAKTKAFAPRTKVEAISNGAGTGLQSLLDGKSDTSHTHNHLQGTNNAAHNVGLDWTGQVTSASWLAAWDSNASTNGNMTATVRAISPANLRNTLGLGASTGALAIANGGTGATDATTARSNLGVTRLYCGMVPYGTNIPADADLNTTSYLAVGNYYCPSTSTTNTLTNCPASEAFMMQVYSPLNTTIDNETTGTWVYRTRKIMTFTGIEYIQSCYTNGTANVWTYGSWNQILNTSTISSYANLIKANRGVNQDVSKAGYWAAMSTGHGIDSNWRHILSMDWTGDDNTNWISQLSLPTIPGQGLLYRCNGNTGSAITDYGWTAVLDSANYTSYTVPKNNTIQMSAAHASAWNSASPMSGKTYMGGWHGALTSGTSGYISIGASGTSTMDLFVDGDMYTWETHRVPSVYISSSTPTAKGTGDIWFVP